MPAPLAFGDISLDVAGQRLWRGGIQQPLEPKAFAVLALLASAPGQVFGRDEILDTVWGHRHVTPGVLSRIMALLRHALGEDAHASRYLHTVHGVGYRLDLPAPATPAGIPAAGTAGVSPPQGQRRRASDAKPARRFSRAALWSLPLMAVLAVAGWASWPRQDPAAAAFDAPVPERRSIAVLPLASADAAQQYFSDGLSENLIATLSQFEGLKVVGSGSSFRFRNDKDGSRAIGAKLGVSHLIDGSVQRIGDNVRIIVELVRTADGRVAWTQRFDRPYRDLFALQDEIALAVAGALQIRLLHDVIPSTVEAGRPASGNLKAYNAYLHGTYNMSNVGDVREAVAQFAEATRLDPGYAQAWAWLGFVRTQHARFSLSGDAANAAYAQARMDIDTALRLQPDHGQAHAIRANLLSTGYYDWNAALAEFRTALPLVPATDPSHGALSRLQATLGMMNESIEERRKYIAGDPLAAFAHVYLVELLASVGRLDEAEASLRQAMTLQPEDTDWYAGQRSYLAILRGDAQTALAEAQRVPPGRWRDRDIALALQAGNDRPAADAALRRLVETDGEAKGGAYAIARAYALRGDADLTFEWMRRDRERRDEGVYHALCDPLLLRFRDDPRFAAYSRETGLPLPSASQALSIDQIRAATAGSH